MIILFIWYFVMILKFYLIQLQNERWYYKNLKIDLRIFVKMIITFLYWSQQSNNIIIDEFFLTTKKLKILLDTFFCLFDNIHIKEKNGSSQKYVQMFFSLFFNKTIIFCFDRKKWTKWSKKNMQEYFQLPHSKFMHSFYFFININLFCRQFLNQ